METMIGYRGQVRSKKEADFSNLRLPEEIPSVSEHLSGKKNQKVVELLKLLWMRCMNRKTGDCKFKTEDMAKLLEVTERSVYRYLVKLQKHGFISRLTQRRYSKQEDKFSATRFIRVHAAVYHSHYNIVASDKNCWGTDFRPSSYYGLKRIPLKYKIKNFAEIPTKFGTLKLKPRFHYNKSEVALPSVFFQAECSAPGRDIIPAETWDEFFLLQDALEDIEGYPGQQRARKILGHSFQDYRTRYVIKTRYVLKEKLAKETTGHKWVADPIPANEMWSEFEKVQTSHRRSA